MPQIGEFTRTQSGYEGRIRTVTLDLNLVFVPTHNADVENAPDYRIHLDGEDGPEIGAGWTHSGEKAGTYISVALDDPMLVQDTVDQAGQQIVQRQLQIAPTLTIRPGFPVSILVGRDLVFESAGER